MHQIYENAFIIFLALNSKLLLFSNACNIEFKSLKRLLMTSKCTVISSNVFELCLKPFKTKFSGWQITIVVLNHVLVFESIQKLLRLNLEYFLPLQFEENIKQVSTKKPVNKYLFFGKSLKDASKLYLLIFCFMAVHSV